VLLVCGWFTSQNVRTGGGVNPINQVGTATYYIPSPMCPVQFVVTVLYAHTVPQNVSSAFSLELERHK
jgi:hypothetical protein